MNRRALLFALVTAVLGVVLLALYERRFELEASGGARIRVLAAAKAIPRGGMVTEDVLLVREVPQAYFEDRMVRETERAKIVGLRSNNVLQAQQTLLWGDLIGTTDDRRDLSSLIQPGSRAVSIRTSRDDSHLGLVRPGDYVDIISTIPTAAGEARAATVLLQRVLVLATSANASADPREGRGGGEVLLTLSVTVPEGQLLALALDRGRLMVVLRNPDDPTTGDRLPDIVATSITDSKERAQIKGVRGPTRLEGSGGE